MKIEKFAEKINYVKDCADNLTKKCNLCDDGQESGVFLDKKEANDLFRCVMCLELILRDTFEKAEINNFDDELFII